MNTGLDSFSNPGAIEALYPFVGTEVLLVIVGVALWLLFHVLAEREETREWEEADKAFDANRLLPGIDEPAHLAEAAMASPEYRQPPPSSTGG